MHVPRRKEPPAALLSFCAAVPQAGVQSSACHAALVPDLNPDPWPLPPAEWGSCSFVPWEAGPCFLSAGRFCTAIGPEACRLRRRLLCMPVPLEPIRSKNGPKLLARPTPALHRPVCGMHLPQLVTSSRPILLHLAPSSCNPRHPRHHQPDTRCNPIVPTLPFCHSGPSSPFPIQHAPCAQLHCAWKLTTRLDPSPSPTSTNRRLLTGVVCCVPALTSCNTVHPHPASALPSERHIALQPSPTSQPSIACRNQCRTSSRPVTRVLLDHTATKPPVHASVRPAVVVAPHGIRSLPRPRTACELCTSQGSPPSPTPKSFLSCHESRPRSAQKNVVVSLLCFCRTVHTVPLSTRCSNTLLLGCSWPVRS